MAADAQCAYRKRLGEQFAGAFVAHVLALINHRLFGDNLNAERIALLAMYHEASKVLTGAMPPPFKYYNAQIAHEYKNIEKIAQQKLIEMVPEALREDFRLLIDEQYYLATEKAVVKRA